MHSNISKIKNILLRNISKIKIYFMVKEKNISPPNEEVSDLELKPLAEVSDEDKEKQADYEKRMKGFMAGFERLQKRWDIKLLLVPARIIYYDKKYEKNDEQK